MARGDKAEPVSLPSSLPVLVGMLMDSTLWRWTGHVLHPPRQPRADLALCTGWCDLSLFASELGLFPENETKHRL